ncbi:MAG: glycosyltransferase family 4 protein [Bacteroidaceae bacterium]|nr:glycosyltransferase family 4 protein [Bacteroidaceae bacterium]
MKKTLLMFTNYFYPEVATTGQILTELAEGLSETFDVTVICEVPSYAMLLEERYKTKKYYFERHKGIKVVRVRVPEVNKQSKKSRVKYILSYFFNSIGATRKLGKFDLVFTVTQPPVLGGILGTIGKRLTGGRLMYQIMDFNPEQTIAVNYAGNKAVLKAMMWWDKRSCRNSDVVVTLGRDMQETLVKRFEGEKVPNNVVINNWIDEEKIFPLPKDDEKVMAFKEEYGLTNKFVIMTSGNIGLYYDFENIVKIIEGHKDNPDVAFVFVGDGLVKPKLQGYTKEHQMDNVVFVPFQKKEDLIYSLNAADIHIVTNAKGIKGVSVPSKIYGILAVNKPIWGILEKGSEAWRIVEDSNCGTLVEAGDYKKMSESLADMITNRDSFVKKHSTGRDYLMKYLTKQQSINAYRDALLSIL